MGDQVKVQMGSVEQVTGTARRFHHIHVEIIISRDRGEPKIPAVRGWVRVTCDAEKNKVDADMVDARLVSPMFWAELKPAFMEKVQDIIFAEAERIACERMARS